MEYCTDEELAELEELSAADAPAILAPIAALSFREWVTKVNPRFQWYKHCEVIGAQLQRIADGDLKRLIIMLPPRHSKSEMVSRLLTSYLVYRFPEEWTALASYGASLAYKLSRASRDFARLGGVQLRGDAEAVHEWETTKGGGLWATGVGGSATGKGFKFGIIDDFVKDAQEAASDVIGERNDDWYGSTWYTRQEPDAALIIVTTRWPGPGDQVGKLFAAENADEHPERWHVIALEAIKTDLPYDIPATCTLEPDWREPGEALCPERYPIEKLRKIWARIKDFFFQSLFQQRESHREGKMFKWAWWAEVASAPVCDKYIRYWDLAGTEPKRKSHDPDYTASTLGGRMADLRTALLDVTAFRESIAQRDVKIEAIARADKQHYGLKLKWWFEKEAGVGGEDRMDALVRRVQALGIAVEVEPASGDKLLRAEPLASAAESGNVLLGPGEWRDMFRTHMGEFSRTCKHDDIADSASGCFNRLSDDDAYGDYGQSNWNFGSD